MGSRGIERPQPAMLRPNDHCGTHTATRVRLRLQGFRVIVTHHITGRLCNGSLSPRQILSETPPAARHHCRGVDLVPGQERGLPSLRKQMSIPKSSSCTSEFASFFFRCINLLSRDRLSMIFAPFFSSRPATRLTKARPGCPARRRLSV